MIIVQIYQTFSKFVTKLRPKYCRSLLWDAVSI